MDAATLPEGWTLWNEEPDGRVVLAYRPTVFDADAFPAPCLPTLYVTDGSRRARPGAGQRRTNEWHVTLFLEPEVEVTSSTYDDRADALTAAVDLAASFAAGDVDYHAAYQLPREDYLAKLDELTGRVAGD